MIASNLNLQVAIACIHAEEKTKIGEIVRYGEF